MKKKMKKKFNKEFLGVGAANPPTPSPTTPAGRAGPGPGGGGARSGLTWGSPLQADPGPTRAPLAPAGGGSGRRRPARGSAPRPRGSGDRGSPPCGQRPRPGGATSGRPRGAGARDLVAAIPCEASPAPFLDRAAKFWGQCSLYCPPCPKIRKNHRGSITFFLQLQIQNVFFFLKGITLAHLPLKSQHFVHVFDAMRAYPNSPKTHLRTLVL
jgi:hypothetical protein